ncbi:MAG: ferric reductase-like transmembrane domain-containing protein [Pseudomonadota bacterium]
MPRPLLIWGILGTAAVLPLFAALLSPLLAYRQPIYIIAGFAGIVGFALMPLQPLAAARLLPGLSPQGAKRLHVWLGAGLVAAVVVHVGGLWIFSPPDVVDALLLRSPTPFSVWGVAAAGAILLAGLLAVLRARLPLRAIRWRILHMAFAATAVCGTVAHVLLIDGTMEMMTKLMLCAVALFATLRGLIALWPWFRRLAVRR